MLDFVFLFAFHRTFGVIHWVAVIINDGSFGSPEVKLKIKAGPSVAQYRLL